MASKEPPCRKAGNARLPVSIFLKSKRLPVGEALGRAQRAGKLTALLGVMPRAAAIAPTVTGPGTITRPIAASVSPGTGITAVAGASAPPAATARGAVTRFAPVTGGTGARPLPVRAGAIAIAGFRHGGKGFHERQAHNRHAKSSEKLTTIHRYISFCPEGVMRSDML